MKGIYTCNLIQQTPMIHFQYDEFGACLRASEVKPKLDKFILKYETPQKSWFIDQKQSQALKYKIQIYTTEQAVCEVPDNKLYFGNMGENTIIKKTVLYKNPISLKIVCFNESLLCAIKKHLEAFFLLHNFGTRQNKGFGSFVLETSCKSDRDIDKEVFPYYVNNTYDIYKVKKYRYWDYKAAFRDIATFSNVLKSGNNHNGYIKSYLVQYCLDESKHEERIGGDKRWLKENKIAPDIRKSTTEVKKNIPVKEFYYNRALFGSAGSLSFIKKLYPDDKPNFKIGKTEIQITGTGMVKRIPSPVLYKYVNNKLYMIVRDHADAAYGAEFEFAVKEKNEVYPKGVLNVPSKNKVNHKVVFEEYITAINNKSIENYDVLEQKLSCLKRETTRIIKLGGGEQSWQNT